MFKKWVVGMLAAAIVGLGGMSAVQANHGDDANCDRFSTGEEVYEFWTSHEYSANNDPDDLDREDDGRPCESLTENMVDQFATYESGVAGTNDDATTDEDAATEDDSTDEAAGAEEGSKDEGDALPVTATSYPTMMLMGLLSAGAGALVLFRRKATQV